MHWRQDAGFTIFRILAIAATLLLGLAAGVPQARAQALVIEGEQIASAELWAAARKEGRVVYYSALPQRNFDQLKPTIEKDLGIKVEFLNLTSQKLFPRVTAEFAAGRLDADLVDLTDFPLVVELVERGVLNRPYKVPAWDRVPADLKDPQGRWYAFVRSVQMIGVNTALVSKEDYPKRWTDLLDPKWKGKIGFASVDAGGSSFSLHAFLRDKIDPDFWAKLARNSPRIYVSVSPAVTDVARGEISIVLTGAATILEQMSQGEKVFPIAPEEGSGSFPISVGITTSAKRTAAAQLLINWITSRRGGNVIATIGYYGPHMDADVPKGVPGFVFPPNDKIWIMEAARWVKVRDEYAREWRRTFNVK